ncbi:MAG: hypothetical protein ACREWE_12410 [Gammaproteobacteria bacterium]
MGLDDLLSPPKLLAQPRILLLYEDQAARLGFGNIQLGSALLGAQGRFLQPLHFLPAPLGQMRAVEPFTAQQRPYLASPCLQASAARTTRSL